MNVTSWKSTTHNWTAVCDDSFLANEAIFDRFFLSTVPPQSLNAAGTTYPTTWRDFNTSNTSTRLSDSSKPLLNSRLKPYAPEGVAPLISDLRDLDKASANLLLDGAFNINSTSVAAWKAFLGGLSGNDIRLFNAGSGSSMTESTSIAGDTKGVVFNRFWSASGATKPNTLWSGLRVLSDTELDDLAKKIVSEVKLRGPFLSLADFLNRRLGSSADPYNRVGAIQAAIDKTLPDINALAKSAGVVVNASVPQENPAPYPRAPNLIPANMKDAKDSTWNTAIGVPGYLMQQDVIQAIAPAISARSDTFVIRTYGEVLNPVTKGIQGKAWVEAVVQRLPEYVQPKADSIGNDPHEIPGSNSINNTYGRRFKIVSFRWLSSNDI